MIIPLTNKPQQLAPPEREEGYTLFNRVVSVRISISEGIPFRYTMKNEEVTLQEAIKLGILNMDSVSDIIMATKKEQVKKLHPYAITPPAHEGGRWQTCYKDMTGKKKNIKAQTEDELWNKLVSVYLSNAHVDNLTFHGLYEEWLEYKKPLTNSPNTFKRYCQHYKRYLEKSDLNNRKIKQIDEILLEKECNRLVKDFHMSRKEWVNVKTILNGMYELAMRKKYLSENPLSYLKIHIKFRQQVKKTGRTETYNSEELADLNRYLDARYAETSDLSFIAVRLNFLLGLRVGELVALKWEDLNDEHHIHIVREEIRNQDTGTYCVEEHTKTHTDRFVILVPKAIDLFNSIPRESEYIFTRNGERLTSRQIAYVLEKYAQRVGKGTKSTHKMRKTYASNLNAAGVPLDCIREMLGHSDLSTTLGYIYNPLTEAETYDLIAKAL